MDIFSLQMNDGQTLKGRYWQAENETAVLQIVHGASEYSLRYKTFAEWLVKRGITVYALDNRGHGLNQSPDTTKVYIKRGDGKKLASDVVRLGFHIQREHPTKPIILLGHSMGSFIARAAAGLDNPYAKYIFSGSGFHDPVVASAGKILVKGIRLVKGNRGASRILDDMTFNNLRKDMRKKGLIKDDHEWLTTDVVQGDLNRDDQVLGQKFSIGAYHALFDVIQQAHSIDTYTNTTQPILFITGLQDPVSQYGRTIAQLARRYRKYGKAEVTEKYYPGMRHEVLNEKERETVFQDVLDFILV